jgi:uncharacterized membrane protein YfcA
MWAAYKKTLLPMQVFIAILCIVAATYGEMPLPAVVAMLVFLEIGALAGAWYGNRLKRKIEAADEKLPLQDR